MINKLSKILPYLYIALLIGAVILAFIFSPRTLYSSLLFLASVLIGFGYLLGLTVSKWRAVFAAILGPVSAIMAILFFFVDNITIYATVLLFIDLIYITFLARERKFEESSDLIKAFLVMEIIAILILPLAQISIQHLEEKVAKEKTISGNGLILQAIGQEKELVFAQTEKMRNDPFVADFLKKGSYEDLSAYAQNLIASSSFNFLVITDKNGLVITRSHKPRVIGDNVKSSNHLVASSLEGAAQAGLILDNQDLALAESWPLKIGEEIVGTVLAGRIFDQTLLKKVAGSGQLAAISEAGKVRLVSEDKMSNIDFRSLAKKANTLSLMGDIFQISSSKLEPAYLNLSLYNFVPLESSFWKKSVAYLSYLALNLVVGAFLLAKLGKKKKKVLFGSRIASLLNPKNRFVGFEKMGLKWENYLNIMIVLALLILPYFIFAKQFTEMQRIETPRSQKDIVQNKPKLYLKYDKSYLKQGTTFKVEVWAENYNSKNSLAEVQFDFDKTKLVLVSEDNSNSTCSGEIDKRINTDSGEFNYVCRFGELQADTRAPGLITTISLKAIDSGISNFSLNSSYSYILTERGKDTLIQNSNQGKENIFILK